MINSWLFQVLCRVHKSLHESPIIYIQTIWPSLGIWQLKDEWIVIITVSSTPAFPSCQNRNIMGMSDCDRFIKEISFHCFIMCCCQNVLDIRWPQNSGPHCTRQFNGKWVAAAPSMCQLQCLWSHVLEVLAQVSLPPPPHTPHCVCSDSCRG